MDRDKNKEEIITLEMSENEIKFVQNLQMHIVLAKSLQQRSADAKNPKTKVFFALASMMEYNHVQSLNYHKFSIDSVIEISKNLIDITSKLTQLEKEWQTSQTKTVEEISNLNELIDQIKTKNLQALEKITKHFAQVTQQEEIDAKQRKLEEELLDNALRSK